MDLKQKKILYIRFCYWLPALLDALLAGDLILYMLIGKTFYLQYPIFTSSTQFLARQVIPLVIGWTILLIWGDRKPIERRIILLLTVIPLLLLGIFLDTILMIMGNELSSLENYSITLIIQAILMIIMLIGYLMAKSLEPF